MPNFVTDNPIKSVTAVAVMVSAIVGAATVAEPYLPAHRGYVRLSEAQVERSMHEVKVDIANGKREATDNDLFKAGLELKRATDEGTKEYIQQQILRLQQTKEKLDRQIDTLERQAK